MLQPIASPYRVTHYHEIVPTLDRYVSLLRERNDPAGYFAAVYRLTAAAIGAAIDREEFQDNHRMAAINVHFFHRYQDALEAYLRGEEMTHCWKACFEHNGDEPITKQHLLLGMNAHINLDLPIAVSMVCPGKSVFEFRDDFLHINRIFQDLYQKILRGMAGVWPPQRLLHYFTVGYNVTILDRQMRKVRERAWLNAIKLAMLPDHRLEDAVKALDRQRCKQANWIKKPGFALKFIVRLIRITERGSVAEKISRFLG